MDVHWTSDVCLIYVVCQGSNKFSQAGKSLGKLFNQNDVSGTAQEIKLRISSVNVIKYIYWRTP